MSPNKAVLLLCLGIGVAACRRPTTPERASDAADETLPDVPAKWAAAQEAVGDVQLAWVASIGDDTLTELVRQAQANNKNLQASAAGVERSWALAQRAGAGLKPQLGVNAGTGSGGGVQAKPTGSQSLGLQASWELDVWGRIRSARQAAVMSAEAVEADYRFSQHSLAAAVARGYFVAIEAGLQAEAAANSLETLKETQQIATMRLESGVGTAQDVALAKSDMAMAQAASVAAEGSQRDALRALEVLLGRYPSADMDLRKSLPSTPPPPGVPSEVLERRPDIVAAERRIAAAFNAVDEAKAARLPRIGLTSGIGGSSGQLTNLLNPANLAWSVGANLVAPLLDGGAGKARVEIATAEQKQAVAAYGQAALEAFKEVESGLDQGVVLRERGIALRQALEEADVALGIAKLRHAEGEADMVDVLTMQRRVFAARTSLLGVERARLEQWIGLNLALGGSWE